MKDRPYEENFPGGKKRASVKSAFSTFSNGDGSGGGVKTFALMAATILGIYICCRMALPFLPAITWALTLAVLFTPFQRWLESKGMHTGLAAAISVSAALMLVAVPATLVANQLVQRAESGAEIINAKVESGEWQRFIKSQPRLAYFTESAGRYVDLPGTVKAFAVWLSSVAGSIIKGSVLQMIAFCITFYLLFFFLRDRREALQSIRELSPLSATATDSLFIGIADTIYATVYGTVAVAALQGLLGGLMFWWLGLPFPLFWGMVMAMFALVPFLGVFVVWIPAALFLTLEGSWGKALILSIWGAVIVGNIDNLLRPFLVGSRLKTHTVLIFMSVIGGLLLFGPSGLIMGPVILTILKALLENWRNRPRAEEAHIGPAA